MEKILLARVGKKITRWIPTKFVFYTQTTLRAVHMEKTSDLDYTGFDFWHDFHIPLLRGDVCAQVQKPIVIRLHYRQFHEPERTNWFAWNYRRTWILCTAAGILKVYLKSFIHPTAAMGHGVVLVMTTALMMTEFSHQDCLVMTWTTIYVPVAIKSFCGKDQWDIFNVFQWR